MSNGNYSSAKRGRPKGSGKVQVVSPGMIENAPPEEVEAPVVESAPVMHDTPAKVVSREAGVLLRARVHDIRDPATMVLIPNNKSVKVYYIGGWLQSQINAGLVEVVDE